MSTIKIYKGRKIRLELTVTVNGASVSEYYGGGRLHCFLPNKVRGRVVERKHVAHRESEGRLLISVPAYELTSGLWGVELVWVEAPPVSEGCEDRLKVVRYPDSPLLGQCNCKVLARACKTDLFAIVDDADKQTVGEGDGTVVIRQSLDVVENPPKLYRDYCIATGYTGTYQEFLVLLDNGLNQIFTLPTASDRTLGGIKVSLGSLGPVTSDNYSFQFGVSEDHLVLAVDKALSSTSTNPVQNKVIKGVVDSKQDMLDVLTIEEIDYIWDNA